MDFDVGARLLRLLPTRPENALSVSQIAERWVKSGGKPMTTRAFQRYVQVLSEGYGSDGIALLGELSRGKEYAYYLHSSNVANWFMTEEAALELQLSRDVLGRSFGSETGSTGDKLADMAEKLVEASPHTQRIRRSIHIAPDGIGRLPARIDKEVLRSALDAIGQGKKFGFEYKSSASHVSKCLVSPLGLVAKDGTIYLVGVTGVSDAPRPYPLHRVSKPSVHFKTADQRPEFDLKRHVNESHQFSHTLYKEESPVNLKLRVDPAAIFHFEERPLSNDQSIQDPTGDEPWYVVTAKVPHTILLTPFLLSMGHWLEVVSPASVRQEVRTRVEGMWAHYSSDEPIQNPKMEPQK